MVWIMKEKKWKPRYFDPEKGFTIQGHMVKRYYGCHMARMLRGFPSMDDAWSTREPLDSIGSLKECMTKNAYEDMYRCMHFSDNWDEKDGAPAWETVYDDEKYGASENVEHHRRKYKHIEDGWNRRWKYRVSFGRWVIGDDSCVAGWYHCGITAGQEPKPIFTGATLHTLCITYGKLATYKLHVRVYGGKHDAGLNRVHQNTANTQKWVNLYDEILDAFKGLGMCCTMDSAYGNLLFCT